MKVLHLIDTFWLGGAQTILKNHFENQKENKDVFVYSLRKRNINISIDHANVICDPSPYRFSIGRIHRILNVVRKNNIEILHCHLPHSQFTGYIIKRFYNPKIKLIFHDHSDIMEPAFHIKMAMQVSGKKADVVITCSNHLVKHLTEKGKLHPDKIKVIPNFINTQRFRKTTKEILPEIKNQIPENNKKIIVFAGRFVKRKGWKEFIDCAKVLKQKNLPYSFIMAGTGPDFHKAKIYASTHKVPIIFSGYYKNIENLLGFSDVYVLSSHWEGMPLTPLEALASGTTVISFDVPGSHFDSEIDKHIQYVPFLNIEKMADAIMNSVHGQNPDLSFYEWPRFNKDLNEIYNSLTR